MRTHVCAGVGKPGQEGIVTLMGVTRTVLKLFLAFLLPVVIIGCAVDYTHLFCLVQCFVLLSTVTIVYHITAQRLSVAASI